MMHLDLRSIARALNGQVRGRQVRAPGPGHSRHDDSLAIWLSHQSPIGFRTHSHAGDDWRVCQDYVCQRLGIEPVRRSSVETSPIERMTARVHAREARVQDEQELDRKRRRANELWAAASDPRGTLVETYLGSRALALPDEIAGAVLRFHPACPWAGENGLEFHPAMIAAMRTINGDEIVGVHRTILSAGGDNLGRRMFGQASGTAVKLDVDENVTEGLTIGEGIETVLAARQLGFRPAWVLGSIGAIASFPVLSGIDALTILEEQDANGASGRGVSKCAERWHAAGREVLLVAPAVGNDINDALREVS